MDNPIITVETSLSVDEAAEAIQSATPEEGFGVVGFHNLNETMAKKGVECPYQVRIVEVCQPKIAAGMIGMEPTIAGAMPCRIAIFDREGKTYLTTIAASALLGIFSVPEDQRELAGSFAKDIQETLGRIMTRAQG
ncbi:MAG: DUF302 domain-containing protein [Planctomycetota bacterium]|jgi:uncharacterized protein (DUF302 family)|nr:DUF302 domain-containing protein [Planctomycetota bacterium]MDP6941312.1 DUF302 domain-containing protein [Planctomycetota bacterium]